MIRGQFRALFVVGFAGLLGACKENLSPPEVGFPEGQPVPLPTVTLNPGSDTIVDSTGTLFVRVRARGPAIIKRIEFSVTPASFTFDPIPWADTAFDASFPIPLDGYRHASFSFSASAIDVLDRRTDTPGVTVTVR